MLTPMDIHNKDFKKATIRGYSTADVDEFLDRVVVDYEKLVRENEKLTRENEKLKEQVSIDEKELAQYHKLEKNMQDALTMAQNTAEGLVTSARKNADDITATAKKNADVVTSTAQKNADEVTATARRNADELLETTKKTVEDMRLSTERECNSIKTQATLEAERKINEAENKLRSIMAEYEKIIRDKNSFLMKMRTSLEAELAITSQMLSSVPHHEAVKITPTTPVSQPLSSIASVPVPTIPATAVEEIPKPKKSPQAPIVDKPVEKPPEKTPETDDLDRTAVFVKKVPRVK